MKSKIFLFAFITTACLVSCSRIKKTDAEIEREQWIAGFTDSIDYYKQRSSQIESSLEDLNRQLSLDLENFEMVRNPREVSGYYILKGWQKKIPMTTTGIYARLNENEKLELIATLGGSTFNKIAVGEGEEIVESETVPHDQAFNFRHERFNTVYFSGGKADTVAEYIADHHSDKLNLKFIEGNKKKNFVLPEDEKNMIYQTWNLYSCKKEVLYLQKELWICSRKIDTFRRLMDAQNMNENN